MKDSIEKVIKSGIKGDYISIVLFGSYSRGDQNEFSDIDVLHVTIIKSKPYTKNNVNYSTYTLDQLTEMAQKGDLFILHIIKEGRILFGSNNVLDYLSNQFIQPKSYDDYRTKLINCAGLLSVNNQEFDKRAIEYYRLLSFLFRSYLYSLMLDSGKVCFSLVDVSKYFNDIRLIKVFSYKKYTSIDYSDFVFCKLIYEEYSKTIFLNKFNNNLDLLKHLKEVDDFSFRIGVHFLQDFANELYS